MGKNYQFVQKDFENEENPIQKILKLSRNNPDQGEICTMKILLHWRNLLQEGINWSNTVKKQLQYQNQTTN